MKRIILFLATTILMMAESNSGKSLISPLGGKEILVVEAKDCNFCKSFNEKVLSKYKGDIPVRVVQRTDIRAKGFKLNKIKGTPTVIFIKDGKELYSYTGDMDKKLFYKALKILKDKK